MRGRVTAHPRRTPSGGSTWVTAHWRHTKTGQISRPRGPGRVKTGPLGVRRRRTPGQVIEQAARKRWRRRQTATAGKPWWGRILGG